MFVSPVSLSLATSIFALSGAALDLDVKSQDSIKGVAKTLAGGIVDFFDDQDKPGSIPGLLPDPYYWWEAGVVFGTLVDYSFLTGDKQYDDLLGEGFKHQLGDYNAFMPANQSKAIGNDDQSSWGLAALSAAETKFSTSKLGNLTWSQLAINVFDTQVARWNEETCGGGLNWQIFSFNNGYTYKDSISNGNFFLLAARLAKFTGNATYSEWAEKAFDWTKEIGLLTDDYNVYDGADDRKDCKEINKIQWISVAGIYTEGAAHMFNVTGGDDKWKKAATGLANNTVTSFKKNDVLYEPACEPSGKCNVDQRAFKGLATRSLARASISAPFLADSLTPLLEASAKAAAKGCSDDKGKVKCPLTWYQDNDGMNGVGETFSALAVVQGLLLKDAKPLATSSSFNGTSAGTKPPTPSGSGDVVENEGGADALFISRGLAVAAAAVAVALL